MKFELFFFGIIFFILYNIYNDYKYTKILLSYTKYIQIIIIAFIGLILYIMIKKNPLQTKQLLLYTNNMIKYMPINKSSMDIITPIFDLTTNNSNNCFLNSLNSYQSTTYNPKLNIEQQKILNKQQQYINNNNKIKRCVSETKKKYVASIQNWKCGKCNQQLKHTFEIDHIISLKDGGTNHTSNLIALCRECHGIKTSMINM